MKLFTHFRNFNKVFQNVNLKCFLKNRVFYLNHFFIAIITIYNHELNFQAI